MNLIKKFKPGCGRKQHKKHVERFLHPETTKSDSMEKMETFVSNIKVSNKFEILADQDTEKDETSNTGVLNPPDRHKGKETMAKNQRDPEELWNHVR
ncbi:hypothetical protein JTB14_038019 [Gonioctena quinquepunctata]|nr:hypothetical protein JTB14_038019 [Gonioctena quinquepunctata]